jgi:hypothetical protein
MSCANGRFCSLMGQGAGLVGIRVRMLTIVFAANCGLERALTMPIPTPWMVLFARSMT